MPPREPIIISDSDTDIEQTPFSQATQPPSSQAETYYEISDDDEPRASTVPMTSSPSRMVAEDDDDDDDDDDFFISSPQKITAPQDKGKGKARAVSPFYNSDSDVPSMEDVMKDLLPARKSTSVFSSSNNNKRRYSLTTRPTDPVDSDETPSPPKKSRPDKPSTSRPRKTADEKALEKELKEYEKDKKKTEREREKRRKDAEKLAKQTQKEAIKAQREQDKVDKAAHKTANKLTVDKKSTLKDTTLVLSKSFESSPDLINLLHDKFDEFEATIIYGDYVLPGYYTVRWKRLIKRKYNTSTRAFEPVKPEYEKLEDMALLRMSVQQLRALVRSEGLVDLLHDFRQTHELEIKDQIFIMIIGMARLRKSKPAEWKSFKLALTKLQFDHRTHYVYVEDEQATVDRLFDFSADLGTREEKLVSRSHLPFCPNISEIKKGKGGKDTWKKMLTQVHRLGDSAAEGIVAEYPSLRSLMMAYERVEPHIAEGLLANCKVDRRKDGQKTAVGGGGDKVGQALSKRVHTVLRGTDHLELVVKDK